MKGFVECHECGRRFNGSGKHQDLADHVNAKHLKLLKFTCGKCSKQFCWRRSYLRHIKICGDRTKEAS